MVKKNACVFISGNGTNLKNLILHSKNYNFPINIKLVVSSKKNAAGLIYAKKQSIPFIIFSKKDYLSEIKIINELRNRNIKIIFLAGYMKVLSKKFINLFNNKIINIHPSLLPKFKGLKTFEKVKDNKEIKSGCTVHFVNEKLDSGKIILKKFFFTNNIFDLKVLKEKTQKLEYKAFPEAIIKVFKRN